MKSRNWQHQVNQRANMIHSGFSGGIVRCIFRSLFNPASAVRRACLTVFTNGIEYGCSVDFAIGPKILRAFGCIPSVGPGRFANKVRCIVESGI
jgi:hypothetical protein